MQNPYNPYAPPGAPLSVETMGKTQVAGLDYNIAALLTYAPCTNLIAAILWLVTEPKTSKFVRFHALQSIFLIVTSFVIFVPLIIVNVILNFIVGSGAIAVIVSLVMFGIIGLLSLGIFVMFVMGMIKAYNRQMWKVPVIGNFAEKYA